jgi:hypothetical protein
MGEKRISCKISAGKPEGKIPLRRARIRWVSKKYDGRACTGVYRLRTRTSGGLL